MKNLILLFLLLIMSCGQVPEIQKEPMANPFTTNDVMCVNIPMSFLPYANLEDQWVCTVDGKKYYCDELLLVD